MPFTIPEPSDLTFGVEEEYQIVDPATGKLASGAQALKARAEAEYDDEFQNELHLCQIEVASGVLNSLDDARDELARLRRELNDAAAKQGHAIVAAGTHPFSHPQDQPVTPKKRYRDMVADYRYLVRELVIFGCHVHVAVPDPELRVHVMNRSRPYLAPLLALTASSPYWEGEETGYDSFRTLMWQRWPMTGAPRRFENRAAYDGAITALAESGSIRDGTKIYWDLRLPTDKPTLEFRVADVCPRLEDAVTIAGLCRAVVLTEARAACDGADEVDPPPELFRAAGWRAARSGLTGDLIDPWGGRPKPATDLWRTLLDRLTPALNDLGDADRVRTGVDRLLSAGNSAARQRSAVNAAGGDKRAAVKLLIGETAAV